MSKNADEIIDDITKSLLQAKQLDQTEYENVIYTIKSIVDNKEECIDYEYKANRLQLSFIEELKSKEDEVDNSDDIEKLFKTVTILESRVDTVTENQIIILIVKVGPFDFMYEYARGQNYSLHIVKYNDIIFNIEMDDIDCYCEKDDINYLNLSEIECYNELYDKSGTKLSKNDFDYFIMITFYILFNH